MDQKETYGSKVNTDLLNNSDWMSYASHLLKEIDPTGFDLQKYSVANMTLKIDSAKNMVSVDKIKDIEGIRFDI